MNTMRTILAVFGCLYLSLHAQAPSLPHHRDRGAIAAVDATPRDPQAVPEGLARSDWQSIRAAYEAGCHAFQPIEGGWQARNPGQQWTTKFDGRGFLAEPRDGGWQWGLELKSYGFGENQRPIRGAPVVKAEGQRLTYQWDASVQEWFVNDQRGLEHGFTVQERPGKDDETGRQGDGEKEMSRAPGSSSPCLLVSPSPHLSLFLVARGTLHSRVSADAQGVEFQNASGATVLNYTGLKVWDADGKVLASRFETAGEENVRLLVEERGARYPLTIDPVAQQAYLKPAAVGATQAGDGFGFSVGVSGDTVVVGALYEASSTTGVNSAPNESATDAGAAYVFVRSAGVWTQQAYLKPVAVGTSQADDYFGFSVAVSGDTVVVGAPFEDSSTRGVNSTPDDTGGQNLNSGAAYAFVRSAGVWTQQAYLKPATVGISQSGDYFGTSVAVSGDTVVVGAPYEASSTTGVNSTPNESAFESGAAYVFARSAGMWMQQAYLKPAAFGTSQAGDEFGSSVAVSGDTAVVGARYEDSSTTGVNSTPNESATFAGAAYVFARSSGVWTQEAYLKPAAIGTRQEDDRFGSSVAVSGDTLVVGASRESSSTTGVNSTPNESAVNSGAAYVFVRSAGAWTQQAYLKSSHPTALIPGTRSGGVFGSSVAASGNVVVVGAPSEDGSGPFESGAVYVFTRSSSTWNSPTHLTARYDGFQDNFGYSVAASGDTVVVGASQEDSSTTGVNSTPNETASQAGAAYIFTLPDTDGDGLLDSWELSFWPTTIGHSALDDFDHDGYVELLELALGLNPTLPNAGGLPAAINEGGYLTMTLTKQPGVTYEVQSAGTLLPALPDFFSAASTTVLINNATTLKVRDHILIGTPPSRYLRLKVTAAP